MKIASAVLASLALAAGSVDGSRYSSLSVWSEGGMEGAERASVGLRNHVTATTAKELGSVEEVRSLVANHCSSPMLLVEHSQELKSELQNKAPASAIAIPYVFYEEQELRVEEALRQLVETQCGRGVSLSNIDKDGLSFVRQSTGASNQEDVIAIDVARPSDVQALDSVLAQYTTGSALVFALLNDADMDAVRAYGDATTPRLLKRASSHRPSGNSTATKTSPFLSRSYFLSPAVVMGVLTGLLFVVLLLYAISWVTSVSGPTKFEQPSKVKKA